MDWNQFNVYILRRDKMLSENDMCSSETWLSPSKFMSQLLVFICIKIICFVKFLFVGVAWRGLPKGFKRTTYYGDEECIYLVVITDLNGHINIWSLNADSICIQHDAYSFHYYYVYYHLGTPCLRTLDRCLTLNHSINIMYAYTLQKLKYYTRT